MKRFIRETLALSLVLAFFACAACAEGKDELLPTEIREFFSRPSFEGMTVLSAADGSEIGGRGACYAVLIRTKGGANALYMFRRSRSGTAWEYDFTTSAAVPQTPHSVDVGISMSGNEWPTDDYFAVPQLSILQMDEGNEYPELCVTFELTEGRWLLHRIWSYADYDSMLIRDGSISYYTELESSRIAGTASGTFQRDLRFVRLAAIPKNLAEARAKLTVAPLLPASAELQAWPVTFTGNRRYDVYSAPDRTSVRGANGKATVSTNSWIQVFGTEEDWVLIQYSIDVSRYRFGYISCSALPGSANVPALSFSPADAWTTASVALTDDPLYSRETLLMLPEGVQVAWLASLGEWAYVEAANGDLARGFVPLSAITAAREIGMRNNPADSGEVIFDGTVTVFFQNDRVEFELTVAPDGPLAGAEVARIRVTDMSGSPLAVLSPDSYGVFYGGCGLGGDVTSLTFTAEDDAGRVWPPTVRVEW